MHDDYRQAVTTRILEHDAFIRATFSGPRPGSEAPWKRAVVRPVSIRGEKQTQVSYFDARRDISKNYRAAELPARLDELLALGFRNIRVETTRSTLDVAFGKGAKPRVREVPAEGGREAPSGEHDRRKRRVLAEDGADRFLQAIGIMSADGRVKAEKRDKYRQIDEFLKLVRSTVDVESLKGSPVSIVDCGCGNAYLTFAAYHYFAEALGLPAHMMGIDVRGELLRKHAAVAHSLGWAELDFQATSIKDFQPADPPDVVLALHACDTATDGALAQAVAWRSRYIFSAPCCHHHLQAQLAAAGAPAPFAPVYRHGILAERMGDVLTDALRALILRIMGYRTDVVQFVSSEHTARNVMIRAVRAGASDPARFVQEYRDLVGFWKVTPHLEELLGAQFQALVR